MISVYFLLDSIPTIMSLMTATHGSDGGGQSAGDLRLRCRQSEGWLSDLDRRGEAGYGYSCHKVDRN